MIIPNINITLCFLINFPNNKIIIFEIIELNNQYFKILRKVIFTH